MVFEKVLLLAGVDYIGTSMMRTLLPQAAKNMGWSATATGAIESFYGIGQILSSFIFGKLSDLYGRCVVLQVSCGGAAAGYAIFASGIFGPYSLLLSRIPVGICKQTMTVSRAIISDISDGQQRSIRMSRLTTATCLGYIIGPLLGEYLGGLYGITFPVWVISFIFCGLIVMCQSLPETSRGLIEKRPQGVRLQKSRWLVCGLTSVTFSEIALAAWTATVLPRLAAERLGDGWFSFAKFTSLLGAIATIHSGVTVPFLRKGLNDSTLITMGNFAFLVGTNVLCIGASAELMLCSALPIAFGISTMRSVPAALLSHAAPPEVQGELMGILDMTSSISRVVAPTAIGVFIDMYGTTSALPLLGLLCGLACVILPASEGQVHQA